VVSARLRGSRSVSTSIAETQDASDADLETDHPLYPKEAYYGFLGPPFGPSNHWEVHPMLEMKLSREYR
jgi:hypothetical protein